MDEVIAYIDEFKKPAEKELAVIYTHGGCYAFYKILKDKFPTAIPYKMVDSTGRMYHVISRVDECFYDIYGQVDIENKSIFPMTKEDYIIAESFHYSSKSQSSTERPKEPKYARKEKFGIALYQYHSKFNKLISLLFTAFMIQGYQKYYIASKYTLPLPICLICFFIIIMFFVTAIDIPLMWSDLNIEKRIWWNFHIESICELSFDIFTLIGFAIFSFPAFLTVLAITAIYKILEDHFYPANLRGALRDK